MAVKKRGITIVPFIVLVAVFLMVAAGASKIASVQSARMVENALEQIVIDTYACEGRYPDSLESIVNEHGFSYDAGRYMIVYETFSDNIRPRIRVIERSDR